MAKTSESKSNASRPNSRFIILLDGTWQTDLGEKPPTNVVRLRDLILPEAKEGRRTVPQHIYYDTGVGTGGGTAKRSIDGVTGGGLEDIVRGAYRQLCHKYEPGMDIFVFGFSRGAFTARSLVGYIHAAGLLRGTNCTASREKKAWAFYRTPKRYRIPAEKAELAGHCWPAENIKIKCLGVFDTVGARGIPMSVLRWRNIERYGFHDTNLSSIVDYAFHALALDEKRRHFEATLWSYAFHHNNEGIEQVWFPGCHSDVGGGVSHEKLSNIPLYWMIRRIVDKGLGLILDEKGVDKIKSERDAAADILGGQGFSYKVMSIPEGLRVVNQTRPDAQQGDSGHLFLGLPRHLKPMREAVHWSVFARMTALSGYNPKSIESKEFWDSIFVDGTPHDTDVVGMDEHFLEWWQYEEDYQAMQQVLPPGKNPDYLAEAAKYAPKLKPRPQRH